MRATASAPSSPIASPPPVKISRKATTSASGTVGKRGRRSKADMAGLVGGDSDSSALTQESGDEVAVGTPRESTVTGTDVGTELGEDEDVEMKDPSPGWYYIHSQRQDSLRFCYNSTLGVSETPTRKTKRRQKRQRSTPWPGGFNLDNNARC